MCTCAVSMRCAGGVYWMCVLLVVQHTQHTGGMHAHTCYICGRAARACTLHATGMHAMCMCTAVTCVGCAPCGVCHSYVWCVHVWSVHAHAVCTCVYGVCCVCVVCVVCVVCGVRVSDSEWLPGLCPGALAKPRTRRLPAALAASLSSAACCHPKGEPLIDCDGFTS